MEELRGCPWCGSSERVSVDYLGNEDGLVVVTCGACICDGPVAAGNNGSDAVRKWNTRSSDAAIKELVEALDKACRSINDLIESSEGVAGLHLNGDVASWGSLRAGGRFESWLIEFDEACDVLAKHKPKD